MKIKFFLFIIITLLLACERREKKPVVVVNDLPAMIITKIDGSTLPLKSVSGKAVLVMFQPDCDHCQREATQIRSNIDSFKEYQLYFVTSAPLAEVEKFSKEYQFSALPNAHFGITSVEEIIKTLGPIDAPSVYIYDERGKLKKSFLGETDIKLILPSL